MQHQLSIKEIDSSQTKEAQKFQCNKCALIVYDTYVTPCNHLFCLHCVNLSGFKCPIDKKDIKAIEIIKTLFLDDYVNDTFRCKCNQHTKGCTWEGSIRDYYTIHSKQCKHIMELYVIDITDSPIKEQGEIKKMEEESPELSQAKEYSLRTSSECCSLNPFIYYFEDYALSLTNDLKWRIKLSGFTPNLSVGFIGVYETNSQQYKGIRSDSKDIKEAQLFQSDFIISLTFNVSNQSLHITSEKNMEINIENIDPFVGLYYPCLIFYTANCGFTLTID